ncbi:MAG: Serine/threonine-protein kinase PrkC, partial [Planctomycetota bacterium]
LLLRIAEAVAHAHHRGVVHRDLTPGNILVGAFGAVHVLDWGLAARAGSGAGVRAGTPGWMAPEQERGDAADPRMDVFALGRLLRAAGGAVLPAGLAAVADRCTDPEPGNRYSDGAAVADELRRWIADGLTLAQEAAPWERALVRWRRSPRVRSAALAGLAAAAAIAGALAVRHIDETRNAQVRLAELERTPLSDAGALTAALAEVRAMRRTLPGLTEATALEARLGAAADLVRLQAEDDALRRRLGALLTRTRTVGPWADQVEAWRGALRAAGLALDGGSEDPERLRRHRLHRDLAAALPFLWRSEHEQVSATAAAQTAALLAAGGPDEGWRALGRLLGITRFAAHDPVFCHCEDAETVLAADGPAAVALALFAPEPRLAEAARVALIRQPGSFWPLIALARSRIAAGDGVGASRLAWTAAGAEPGSLLPHLLIAYAALDRSDGLDDLGAATDRAAAIAPGNLEVAALQAVARARAGRIAAAQAALDRIPAAHLRYHLEHPVGHPMERSVRAAVAAGLRIPDAAPEVGPLDRHSGH